MKSILKRFIPLSLLVLILIFTCGFADNHKQKIYIVDNIMNTIEKLTSKEFGGRMTGTPGGTKTEEYIASIFKGIGLTPGGVGGTYFQEFPSQTMRALDSCILEVLGNGKVIKKYSFGRDYYHILSVFHSGDTTGKGLAVELGASNIPKAAGEIALLDKLHYNDAASNTKMLDELYNAGYRGFVAEKEKFNVRKKGAMGSEIQDVSSRLPRVAVTSAVYNELLDYSKKGCMIHIKSDFTMQKSRARNVIGLLKASNPTDKYFIVSGHMDFIEPDPDGVEFPGALDNASGTSCMMEIARALSSREKRPDVNIIFIAFSGEEEGLIGSRYYAEHPLYPLGSTRVINLDMVGAKSDVPMSISSSSSDDSSADTVSLIHELSTAADSQKSEYVVTTSVPSDHISFADVGVPAITIIDMEEEIYHVPQDTIENIGVNNLIRDMDAIMEVIDREAYPERVVSRAASDKENSACTYMLISAGAIAIIFMAVFLIKMKKASS